MAYTVELVVPCQGWHCPRRAVVELHRYNNEPAGRYCRPCGKLKLREMERDEQAMWERRRKEGSGTPTR